MHFSYSHIYCTKVIVALAWVSSEARVAVESWRNLGSFVLDSLGNGLQNWFLCVAKINGREWMERERGCLKDDGCGRKKKQFQHLKLAYPIKILIETHRFTWNIWLKEGRRWKSIDLARMRNWHGVTGSAENHIRWIDLLRHHWGRRWCATC